ncbi:L-rhamnose mutarotase [Geodermatophilus sp. YIM 151500]|uniref:L-rhamnose mutarotase n=1 Tax=Geodermatophilus sp. YIM 151500 TaxID=2984531 RepID=UPI0021E35EF3|nr:L-rhamnose mutarotase [Geodermatophilus sp. YIM 151500]MCV2490062.1 L-rhamnose mutarotase [Geodermatophilus sp. YIM 151500]
MPRVCFTLQVRPDRLDDYRERHAAVWPEMLRALRDAGWRDYRLFLRDDGLLVGTVDVDDLAAAQAAVDATEVSARWEAEMAPLFTAGTDGRGKSSLDLVFDLDAQLAALGEPGSQPTTARTGDRP